MRSACLLGVLVLTAVPSSTAAQDTTRRVASRRADTTVRFARPVSSFVVQTARVASQRQSAGRRVVAKPRWSSEVVLRRRVTRSTPLARGQVLVRTRRVPARATRPTTASDDSTIARQRGTDFRTRADAVARVADAPTTRVHPTIAANLISELDSVGTVRLVAPRGGSATADPHPEDEAFSEYVVDLTRAVVSLGDPRGVRAVALGGLSTSRQAQRFVAEHGTAGLAVLDTVFATSDEAAAGVVTTWAYTLSGSASRLGFADSVYVYARIVLAAQFQPVAFAHAARIANLFELLPELEALRAQAMTDSSPAVAAAMRVATRQLTDRSASASAADWLARLRLRTGAMCMDAAPVGVATCRGLLDATNRASRALGRLPEVRAAMSRYVSLLDTAVGQRRITAEVRDEVRRLTDGLLRASGDRTISRPTGGARAVRQPATRN